ncbi:MAG TPA: ROK family transcriptional regulator [Chitinophagaceae bacterium]|nr:ROK family transcriptional regulator [Chitinophagaceae bacterium]
MLIKSKGYKPSVLKQLYLNPQVTCAELSSAIGKSLPIVTRLLNELIQDGLVKENGFAASTGGRRAMTYSLAADALYLVSVAMDQFITRVAIMNMSNEFVRPVVKIELPLANHAEALDILVDRIREIIYESGIAQEKIAGIGIGMPGFVDVNRGLNYSFLDTGERSIMDIVRERTGLPVFIDNDSSLIALAELRFGAARGRQNVMVINVGWGVGLGMILSGELFRGHNGFAGEFSHIPLFQNGKLCQCGKTGCLETEASMEVMVEKAREGLRNGRISHFRDLPQDFEEACKTILDAAVIGDQFAVELLSESAYNIGRGIATLIHIINPELIVLSGRGAGAGKLWLAPIQQALNRYCIPRLAAHTDLSVSTLGNRAELIGAAALVMEHFDKKTPRPTASLTPTTENI